MNRHIIIASHSTLAAGIAETLRFFEGEGLKLTVITAYVDNKPIEDTIRDIFKDYNEDDEYIILTDLMAGSVNQKFVGHIFNKEHVHLIAGMNLSLAMAITMEPKDSYISEKRINKIIEESRKQIIYVNESLAIVGEDEEDE
ncbi:PTS N-acetylglucosamine transporter subunit IIBC [Ligilactobacillus salivarius]|uniref:PTS sugar transporter subunit IIA n=1 Tax=Ligilactobacillus salivarius TaxID=1624 RepID=UPI0009D92FEC|nr:PTS N-acetylglucosamine transporter subunit IIBC [Ligilactobacillus salivarius]OQQ73100.1 PTS N-acetylglucosamine transporter subunit IIBC [Ligilactobacillus salivarius]